MANTVTLKDFVSVSIAKKADWLRDTAEVKALRTIQIANAALELLADGQRRTAGEIAKAIGKVGFIRYPWLQSEGAEAGDPCEVNGQTVAPVMSKLMEMGKIKRETVDGEPMEVTKCGRFVLDEQGHWVREFNEKVMITPKINYYSLV